MTTMVIINDDGDYDDKDCYNNQDRDGYDII